MARICRSQSSKDDQFRQGRGSIPRFGIILLLFARRPAIFSTSWSSRLRPCNTERLGYSFSANGLVLDRLIGDEYVLGRTMLLSIMILSPSDAPTANLTRLLASVAFEGTICLARSTSSPAAQQPRHYHRVQKPPLRLVYRPDMGPSNRLRMTSCMTLLD